MSKKPFGKLMNTEHRRYCYHCGSGEWVSMRILVATGQPVYVCRKNECRSATREVAKQEYKGA